MWSPLNNVLHCPSLYLVLCCFAVVVVVVIVINTQHYCAQVSDNNSQSCHNSCDKNCLNSRVVETKHEMALVEHYLYMLSLSFSLVDFLCGRVVPFC